MVNFTFSSSVGWVEARNPTDIKCHERLGWVSLHSTQPYVATYTRIQYRIPVFTRTSNIEQGIMNVGRIRIFDLEER